MKSKTSAAKTQFVIFSAPTPLMELDRRPQFGHRTPKPLAIW
jgi:hypothetical protein